MDISRTINATLKFRVMDNAEQDAFMCRYKFDERAQAAWRVAREEGNVLATTAQVVATTAASDAFYTWGCADDPTHLISNITQRPQTIERDLCDICADCIGEGDTRYINALKDVLFERFCKEFRLDVGAAE